MSIALDKLQIPIGNGRKADTAVAALHPQWVEDVGFVTYEPPPLATAEAAAIEEWVERITFIQEDLHWLLKLPHHKFWCQVIFDESLQKCIDSFLKHAPRDYDLVFDLPSEAKEKHNLIHKQFFMTCLRMATHKESKEHFITPKVFGDILYENFLFDIPKLMDMCILYGSQNGTLLSKMITNIFTQQPKYDNDLHDVVPTMVQVFDSIEEKCGTAHTPSSSPQKLSDSSRRSPLLSMTPAEFQDVVFYLVDTCATLWAFLEVYPAASKMFWQAEFPYKLALFYESTVLAFGNAMKERECQSPGLKKVLISKLHKAQDCLLRIFRQIVFQASIQPVLENVSKADDVSSHVEDYLQLMSSLLSERRFLGHLESLFPFCEDKDFLTQLPYTIDETRLAFLQEGINEAFSLYGKQRRGKSSRASAGGATSQSVVKSGSIKAQAMSPPAAALPEDYQVEEYGDEMGACAGPRLSGVELESLIMAVKDLLPDLGDGFIELCLHEYNYEVERVINAVLEDKLLPSLQNLDVTMPRSAEEPEPETLLSQRKNLYDEDEFDVFSKDKIDTSKIYIGKKEKNKDILDDKTDVSELRGLYNKYSDVIENIYKGEADYEDEYDDTYDSNLIGAEDADSADELTSRRPFTVPRVLGTKESSNSPSWLPSDEDSDEEKMQKDHFIQDPAKIREAQADRWAYKAGRNQKKASHKVHEVKGNPKGQGQEKDVVRNRAWKEKNKSTRVHHNRKALSDKKRKL